MPTCVVVGNPKPASRTLAAAISLVQQLTGQPPTYKATYTGLLKMFLYQFGGGSLDGGLTSLMLGAGLQHALAPELLLEPVPVEIGGTCPRQGPFLLDTDTALTGAEQWLHTARRHLPEQYTSDADVRPVPEGSR